MRWPRLLPMLVLIAGPASLLCAQSATDATKSSPKEANRLLIPAPIGPESVLSGAFVLKALILQIEESSTDIFKNELRKRMASTGDSPAEEKLLHEHLRKNSAVTILSRPQIALRENTPGQISIGDERELQYMMPAENGLFRLMKTKPVRLGMDFGVTARFDEATNRFHLEPVELALFALEGREQVIETDLPVGKPRIARRSVSTSLELAPGQTGLVELQVSEQRQVWLGVSMSKMNHEVDDPLQPAVKKHP